MKTLSEEAKKQIKNICLKSQCDGISMSIQMIDDLMSVPTIDLNKPSDLLLGLTQALEKLRGDIHQQSEDK